MYTNEDISAEVCRKLLRRAAWRIQYKTRIQQTRECGILFDNQVYDCSFETEILSQIYVNELLQTIPWEKCRFIIQRTVIDGKTEKEVAYELQITQQGVNKWKKKGLELIRQNLANSQKQ